MSGVQRSQVDAMPTVAVYVPAKVARAIEAQGQDVALFIRALVKANCDALLKAQDEERPVS